MKYLRHLPGCCHTEYSVCQFNDYVAGKVTDSTTGIGIQATPTVSATMDVKDGQVK